MGKKYKINLSTGIFKLIREAGTLYIDKSKFIENIIEEPSSVLLFTRPCRMGKTTNLTMLQSFFDMSEDNEKLFDDLYIKNSSYYEKLRGYPVIYLDFKELTIFGYNNRLGIEAIEQLKKYVEISCFIDNIPKNHDQSTVYPTQIIRDVTRNIYEVTGKKSIILIDEYDKLFMDSIGTPEFERVRSFLRYTMISALKDNPYLEKAVITGVNRITQESMFSDLNNLSVFDVFMKSAFDTDFGFSEREVKALIDDEDYEKVRLQYNNCRIGNAKVFFTYSVLSFLARNELRNYWGQSGTITRIAEVTTDKRLEEITGLIGGFNNGRKLDKRINPRLCADDLMNFTYDEAYYSILVQTGYLTFDYTDDFDVYSLYMPNLELMRVWQDFIINKIDTGLNRVRTLEEILKNNPPAKQLSYELMSFLNNRISYMDVSPYEPEFTYHMLILGMMLGFGYNCKSNREAGNGRYDILVTARRQNLVFEFKSLDDEKDLEQGAKDALAQIEEKKYYAEIENAMPVYLVGIAFCGKVCSVCVAIK